MLAYIFGGVPLAVLILAGIGWAIVNTYELIRGRRPTSPSASSSASPSSPGTPGSGPA